MFPRANDSIYNITPYVGGDVTPPGFSRRIVLASNENPFGPSPEALKVIHPLTLNLASYPSGKATTLTKAISEVYGIPDTQIICGNGSEELLHMIAKAFAEPGDDIVSPLYGFGVYRIATHASGANLVFYDQPKLNHSVESILKAITPKTKILFLDNPANPLGCALMKDDLLKLLKGIPSHVLIALDEAYAEFVADDTFMSGLEVLDQYPNLMVLRTFSKAYGLAGMRVGYAFAHHEIIDPLHRIRAPFNVSSLAQAMAAAAIHDKVWVKKTRDHSIAYLLWTEAKLKDMGIKTVPSFGNFFLLDCKTPEKVDYLYKEMGTRGIMLRPMKAYGLHQYIRVSIGKAEEMEEFVEIMGELKDTFLG